jgi:small conductance mechanosensitive channel
MEFNFWEKTIVIFETIILKIIKIFAIFLFAFLFNRSLYLIIKKYLEQKIKDGLDEQRRKRIQTLLSAVWGTLKLVIWLLAFLMVLPEFGINIGPILVSLGLAGFAIGLAAKDILSDFISGLFVLLEDQYHVGDRIKVGNLEGEVVEFNLRRTIIKDDQGNLHLIPNSQIKIVSKKP